MSIPQFLFDTQQAPTLFFSIPQAFIDFLTKCLTPNLGLRSLPKDLVDHPLIKDAILYTPYLPIIATCFETTKNRTANLDISKFTHDLTDLENYNGEVETFGSLLQERNIHEVFYLWSLAGGDLMHELEKNGLVQSKAPICSLPQVTTKNKERFGQEKEILMLYSGMYYSFEIKYE